MNRRSEANEVKRPSHEELIAHVSILDAQGRVVRGGPAAEFRRN